VAEQLTLPVGLRDSARFENFEPGRNQIALAMVRALAQGRGEPQAFLHGAGGSGKTHLLLAAAVYAQAGGAGARYLGLGALEQCAPDAFEGLEDSALVCVDDVERVAGDAACERALFGLINRARERGAHLLMAGAAAPSGLGIALPDLVSRLGWGPVFRLALLDDADKIEALCRRAQSRGFELPTESARYLLQRCPRDLGHLLGVLERIDTATLSAQRRATLPFLRGLLRET
jgi:DnaA family protein